MLWIVYGALGLVGGAVAASASTTAGIVQLGFGAVFLITGIQVLMGKASGLMLTGITCIVLGGLVLLFVLSTIARASDAYAAGYALGVMSGGVLLVTAGILALVGNGRYKQWIAQRPR